MSRLGGVKGWAREWRQQGEGAVGREGLSPRFWPWKSCAHHQWISGIILLLPILITTMYLSKYLQVGKRGHLVCGGDILLWHWEPAGVAPPPHPTPPPSSCHLLATPPPPTVMTSFMNSPLRNLFYSWVPYRQLRKLQEADQAPVQRKKRGSVGPLLTLFNFSCLWSTKWLKILKLTS